MNVQVLFNKTAGPSRESPLPKQHLFRGTLYPDIDMPQNDQIAEASNMVPTGPLGILSITYGILVRTTKPQHRSYI